MLPARRAVARRTALVLLFLMVAWLGISCARPKPPAYVGSWVLQFRGHNLMLITLAAQGQQIKGTLVSPEHFTVDQEGYFHAIQPPLVERMLTARVLGEGRIELEEEGGDHDLNFQVVDLDRAEVRPMDAPDYTAPWVFERVRGDTPLVVSDWGKEGERSPEVKAAGERLLAMAEEDQAVRQGRIQWKKLDGIAAKHKPEIVRIHETFGWPKRSTFGMEAADAFWLLVQHQGHELQKQWLPELERLVEQGEASRQNYTLLFDRVRKGDGRPQRYGNSTSCVDGAVVLDPVEDEAGLAERRARAHLPPIAEYLKMLAAACLGAP